MRDPVERFHEKYVVDPITGCWNWTAALDKDGYSRLTVKCGGKWRSKHAARWYLEHLKGPLPSGVEPDHRCCNTRCVNPVHLEPVTSRINIIRANKRRKGKTYKHSAKKATCRKGHEFTPETTIEKKNGARCCRVCRRQLQRNWIAKKRKENALRG